MKGWEEYSRGGRRGLRAARPNLAFLPIDTVIAGFGSGVLAGASVGGLRQKQKSHSI
jgi:hypothetical protein